MQSDKGNYIANQFIINTNDGKYFQSYNSITAFIPIYNHINTSEPLLPIEKIILDNHYWNYSRTTSKYRSIFLGENTDETKRKIKEGIYKLENLN